MDKKIIIEYSERWTSGGIESYILNLVKLLNHSKFDIRIVVSQKETDIYDKELSEYGINVIALSQIVYHNPILQKLLFHIVF
jgi:hypothetical protein